MMMKNLIPTNSGGDKASYRSILRGTIRAALQIPEVHAAVEPFKYKTNGTKTGHKVGDNIKATEAMIDKAPTYMQAILTAPTLTLFEKSQVLDGVLRYYWVMDKAGKIDGTPNPKYLLRQHTNGAPVEATEEAADEG